MRLYYKDGLKGKLCVHSTNTPENKEYQMKPYTLKRQDVVIESGIFCPKDFTKVIQFQKDILSKTHPLT